VDFVRLKAQDRQNRQNLLQAPDPEACRAELCRELARHCMTVVSHAHEVVGRADHVVPGQSLEEGHLAPDFLLRSLRNSLRRVGDDLHHVSRNFLTFAVAVQAQGSA
jgi:hypothetical protein